MEEGDTKNTYKPSSDDSKTINLVLRDYVRGRTILNKSYPQFNGRNLFDSIDDWTKRWNGYIPEASPLLEKYQSRIFLNFTRNQIISYLVKTAIGMPDTKIIAVNKKTGLQDKRIAEILKDLNTFSLNEENGDARFMESAIEATTKGTVIKYEGYARSEQKMDIPVSFDAVTGKLKTRKETRVVFDNCFQEIVPVEDLYIANPYQPDIQKQPFICWRKITTRQEAEMEYGNYPNWDAVPDTAYLLSAEPTTFYRSTLQTELGKDQVEVLKYYNRFYKDGTKHVVLINGVVIYDGPIPFKDGKYPFAKGIFEPFGNDFFWGAGFPNKIQGDQDLLNTVWNMMVDKTYGSLLPFGLSSDLDDVIEDEWLQPNKVRKVGDINKWRFESLPGVNAGETTMLQLALKFANDNSGSVQGGAKASTPKGGQTSVRQVLLEQQESMTRLGFSMSFLEDFERDRTELRVNHILQFYSIPKIEKITAKNGKEIEKLLYRDIKLTGAKLSDGKEGEKIIKLTGKLNDNQRIQMGEDLSVLEEMGYQQGIPTEALAIDVDTFLDYNTDIQIVKNSSYEHNNVLDQAQRMEFVNWRLSLAQIAPLDSAKLVKWAEESWDVDPDQFDLPKGQETMPGQQPGSSGEALGAAPGQPMPAEMAQIGRMAPSGLEPAKQLGGSKLGQLSSIIK